jgi:hypothetical protein
MAKVDVAALKKACGRLAEEVIEQGATASDAQVNAALEMGRAVVALEED